MKQLILVSVLFCMFVFSGCGKTDKASIATKNATNPNSSSSSSSTTNEKSKPGTELSTFMSNYIDSKTKLWDNMSKNLDTQGNTEYLMGIVGFSFADMAIIEIPLYDTLLTGSNGMFKGKLMLSGIDAWKKVNGNIIEFGYDYTYVNDENGNEKGDHQIAKGKFDIKAQSVTYENYTERSSKKISRTVVEITANSDKSYSSEIFAESSDNKLSGYFTWFDGNNISSAMAEKDNADINYTYSSIYGKKSMKVEDMTNGLNVKVKSSYVDGKAAFENID